MTKTFLATILLAALTLLAGGCGSDLQSEPSVTSEPNLFKVVGHDIPQNVVQDVANELARYGPEICRLLDHRCTNQVLVEVFPSQEALDQQGMNPEMQGYYAYSGRGIIQMVSPLQPIPGLETEYADRLQIAVHEYVHLVNDEINPAMPLWLDEGVAVYTAPHQLYETVTRRSFPFEMVPRIEQLEESYETVPAADLFAFSLVEFIAAEYGQEKVNKLIRSPESIELVLGLSRAELEVQWNIYMEKTYASEP